MDLVHDDSAQRGSGQTVQSRSQLGEGQAVSAEPDKQKSFQTS